MSRPRLLIFGARGFLGGWIQHLAQDTFEVVSIEGRVDVRDAAACARVVDELRPDWVFLLAAMSDIDRCQQEPQLAEAVNVRGAENVARACLRTGARLLFTSSGAVFDGSQRGYFETDPVSPVNVYGESKARAERVVTDLLPDALVVRLSLVLGVARSQGTNALVNKLLASWKAGKPVPLLQSECRNAIDAPTLASILFELARAQARGIYHAGAADALSRFEIGRGLAAAFGYAPHMVQAQEQPPAGRAPRGPNEFLRTHKLATICRTPIPACEEAIRRCAHAMAQSHP
jgi:dTDP-4-dehydrorhamnose reductase